MKRNPTSADTLLSKMHDFGAILLNDEKHTRHTYAKAKYVPASMLLILYRSSNSTKRYKVVIFDEAPYMNGSAYTEKKSLAEVPQELVWIWKGTSSWS
mmetsp:Transcript_3183/g.3878  ORF Transcript_3183/g.3878 Transcript_3183/m.3878 type:complete len:98 (+) Transcript_3183:622-915(+)